VVWASAETPVSDISSARITPHTPVLVLVFVLIYGASYEEVLRSTDFTRKSSIACL
jgi:hypothetical protein